jgi:hypothetical protein
MSENVQEIIDEIESIDPSEYTFKDAVLKLYELMGLGSVTMEYEELPGLEVTVSIDEQGAENAFLH